MSAWTAELEFAYDHGRVYMVDAGRHWSEADVDLRMPRSANFFVPLRVEGWGAKPPLDLDGWDHVTEFSLALPSGRLALESGGQDGVTVELPPGAYRARWSGCDRGATDRYRLQIWPGPAAAPRADIKLWAGSPRGELGDLPALLADEALRARGVVVGGERIGDGLRVDVRVSGTREWERSVRAGGVVRWVLRDGDFTRAALFEEHPALLPYADDQGGLSFHGRPESPARLADALRTAHERVAEGFVAFADVVNAEVDLERLLALGYGRLAAGPLTLLRRYAEIAEAYGVRTRLDVTGPGRAGLSVLELGETYVVAERFSV